MTQGDERLKHLAQVTANAIAQQYNRRYQSRIPVPVPLEFDLEHSRPKAAGRTVTGQTTTSKGGIAITGQKVQLNMTLYRDNEREFLNVIIPHEMAHLKQEWEDVKNQAWSIAHGYVWQIAMREMSQVPKSTHSMDTTKAIAAYKEHKAKAKQAKAKSKETA
jgi:predicted SprT family Zn-dependent metalloprotease